MTFVIQNSEGLFWSTAFGWGSDCACDFTVFSAEERYTLDLPIGGYWVQWVQ